MSDFENDSHEIITSCTYGKKIHILIVDKKDSLKVLGTLKKSFTIKWLLKCLTFTMK